MTSYAKLVFVIVFQTLLGIRVFSHFIILLERAKGDTDQWYSSSYAHFLIQPLCQRTFYHAITRILDATLISSLLMEDRKLCHICNHRLYARREFTSCSKLVLTLHKKNCAQMGTMIRARRRIQRRRIRRKEYRIILIT